MTKKTKWEKARRIRRQNKLKSKDEEKRCGDGHHTKPMHGFPVHACPCVSVCTVRNTQVGEVKVQ